VNDESMEFIRGADTSKAEALWKEHLAGGGDAATQRGRRQRPSVGSIVHYVSYGTPGGEYPSVCRAAVVTEVPDLGIDAKTMRPEDRELLPDVLVGLAVLNPSGMFFPEAEYDGDGHRGGTWHWPEGAAEALDAEATSAAEPPADLREAIARAVFEMETVDEWDSVPAGWKARAWQVADAVLPVVERHVTAAVEQYRLALSTLVEGLSPDQRCACDDCQAEQPEIERVWTLASDVLLDGQLDVAARLRAEGAAQALREAAERIADQIGPSAGTAVWLRERADRIAAGGEQ
jgi:hypothetical protein